MLITENLPTYKYLWLDPSSGKKAVHRRVRSRAALVVCTMDNLGRVFVLDCWTGRGGAQQMAEVFVDRCEKWQPRVAGWEDAGQQMLLMYPILAEAAKRNLTLPLRPIPPMSGVDKKYRIRALLQPVVAPGRLFIQEEHVELKAELISFPLGASQDIIDALASCIHLMPPPQPMEQQSNEQEEFLEYLRESGAPPDVIMRESTNMRETWWQRIVKDMDLHGKRF